MRDNRWLSVSSVPVGADVRCRLRDWTQLEQQYGSYNRAELDNLELLSLPTYWAEEVLAEMPMNISALQLSPISSFFGSLLPSRVSIIPPVLPCSPPPGIRRHGQPKPKLNNAPRSLATRLAFSDRQLRHLGVGRFWGQDAKPASRSAKQRGRGSASRHPGLQRTTQTGRNRADPYAGAA